MAQAYYESGLVEFAHPNFYRRGRVYQSLPNDEYFPRQYSLHNTGQANNSGFIGAPDADIDAPEAWQISTGNSNIIVAVIDDGVTADHPDLPNSRQVRLAGSNFQTGDPNDPSPAISFNNHGNRCAGLIAATQNNSQGVAGVCPNCRVMPIRTIGYNGLDAFWSDASMAAALDLARTNGARVMNNSWGYTNTSNQPNYVPAITSAIQNAVNAGIVVVFPTGENGGGVFPGNVNIPSVLTVGASDRFDQRASYSSFSTINPLVDLVATSNRGQEDGDVWTIDIPGLAGNNPSVLALPNSGTNFQAYSGGFGGTSASCALVAGAAALVLSVQPNLTPMQVFNILTSSADKVGGYNYVNGRNDEMGFGRLNVHKALLQVIAPNPSQLAITPASFNICPNQSVQLTSLYNNVNLGNSANPSPDGIQEIQWGIAPSQGSLWPIINTAIPGARTNVTLSNSVSFSVSIQVRARNYGGWSSWRNFVISGSCGSGFRFAYGPNPGQETLTITAQPDAGCPAGCTSSTCSALMANCWSDGKSKWARP